MVEIRTTDRAGLLAVLTRVFERAGVDIDWAKVTTLGSSVVDAFCFVVPALAKGSDADAGDLEVQQAAVEETLERELYKVLPATAAGQAGRSGQLG